MVKLDFANAFNSLHREDMLLAVRDRLPELYPYVHSAYSLSSLLHFGSSCILSAEGPQQGDPLGALLFSLTIHPLLDSLNSALTLGYLDDLTLGDDQAVIADDVSRVISAGSALGLSLNIDKCEIITRPTTVINDPLLQSFIRLNADEASLLGAPLFQGAALDQAWAERCEDMDRAADRLSNIGSQDALLLLRASFGAPRVHHLLRCSPSVGHPGLATFDDLQRGALSRVANANLSDDQWTQATLPIRDGGLGLRRVASLALPSFLASSVSSALLQDALLSNCVCPADPFLRLYSEEWSSLFGTIPAGASAGKQSSWDRPGISLDLNRVWSGLNTSREKAVFLAASAQHSGS